MLTATPAKQARRTSAIGEQVRRSATKSVSADSVALFRFGFGALITFSSLRFLTKGWVTTLYLEPANHLTYPGFGWVQPLPSFWMHALVISLAVCGIAVALGFHHRLATAFFLAGFAYTESIEAALYLNHYWFLTVTAAALLLLPVHHHLSLDARSGRAHSSAVVASWVVWTLRAQLAVVYLFAGLGKLNSDWLFDAQPMSLWLADKGDLAIAGPVLNEPVVAYLASWAGAVFDLTIVGWLLWRPSRKWAYGTLVLFHLITGALFPIGVFPWVMIVCTLIFFEPDWPSQRFAIVRSLSEPTVTAAAPISRIQIAAISVFALVQLILPLRHYAYDGNVRWTEDGYYLSWRVMLTDKAGFARYVVTDPKTSKTWEVDPQLVLTDWQANHAATKPGLVHATAHLIRDHYESQGLENLEVRTIVWVSMNAETAQLMVDPTVDLAGLERTVGPSSYVCRWLAINDVKVLADDSTRTPILAIASV